MREESSWKPGKHKDASNKTMSRDGGQERGENERLVQIASRQPVQQEEEKDTQPHSDPAGGHASNVCVWLSFY